MNDLFPVESSSRIDVGRFKIARCERIPMFEVAVPHNATIGATDTQLLRAIEGDGSTIVEVTSREFPRELNPADLVLLELEQANAEVVAKRVTDLQGVKQLDVLFVNNRGGLSRRRTYSLGCLVFEITVSGTRDWFSQEADAVFLMLSSFKLIDTVAKQPEKLETYKPTSNVPIEFQYINSWRPVTNTGHSKIQTYELVNNYYDATIGRICLLIVAARDGERLNLIEEYRASLVSAGYDVSGAPVVPRVHTEGMRQLSYDPVTHVDGTRLESPTLLFEYPDATVLLGLIGSDRNHSPVWWAINKRAFEVVRDSLRVGAARQS